MDPDQPIYEDLVVLDLTTFVTGGFASLMLANQGAEVIKIERPGVGDDNRHSGPPFIDDESPYFWTVNYGKKSVELDLKTTAGIDAVHDLVEHADVFIQNFRPGTAKRLDLGYETIADRNDDIIYCAISAFGQTGPWRERPGYDLLIQGLSGIMSVTGEEDGSPVKVGLPQTDLITGMWAAFGISTCLYRRELTGEGEYIDLGMLDAALPWLTKQAGKVFADESPSRMGTRDPVLAPYQTFSTQDGMINVACLNQKLWREFCEAIDRTDLIDDDRFATNADRVNNMDSLERVIEATLEQETTAEWVSVLVEEAGIPAAPVFSVEEALSNEQVDARDMVSTMSDSDRTVPTIDHPLNFGSADSGFKRLPPRLGEHTRSVLSDIGYSKKAIDRIERAAQAEQE